MRWRLLAAGTKLSRADLELAREAREALRSVLRANSGAPLRPGSRHVVLGDPGSGKSTLLRFLSLVAISKPLRERYGAEADDRLAILVVLRRYADDLKENRNISLIDHVIATVQADFSLKAADLEFFEYGLENGRAVLLFDGLDELPNPQFKKLVADRIRGLLTTYPGNTAIVTSRIVGYEAPFRFDDQQFRHVKLARLRLPEIEQFIQVEVPQRRRALERRGRTPQPAAHRGRRPLDALSGRGRPRGAAGDGALRGSEGFSDGAHRGERTLERRDLAYGDESRTEDLGAMVLVDCLEIPAETHLDGKNEVP